MATTPPSASTAAKAASIQESSAVAPPIDWVKTVELSYDLPAAPDKILCFACHTPLPPSSLKRCSKCRVAAYCGQSCQVQDWKKRHKAACVTYQRVGPSLTLDPSDRPQAVEAVFGMVRLYGTAYAVWQESKLGRGFLFVQASDTLLTMSLGQPVDGHGRQLHRAVVMHYLTAGEYDSEVIRDDFELGMVRTELLQALDRYDCDSQVVLLVRFRCGHLAVGMAPLAAEKSVCKRLGQEYFAQTQGALQLNLDDNDDG